VQQVGAAKYQIKLTRRFRAHLLDVLGVSNHLRIAQLVRHLESDAHRSDKRFRVERRTQTRWPVQFRVGIYYIARWHPGDCRASVWQAACC
jgi:hypothetical protein